MISCRAPQARPALSALPADVDAVGRAERLAQQIEQVLRGAAVVTDDVDGVRRDVVVLIFARFLLERLDQYLEILLGDLAKQGVRVGVIEINHRFSCLNAVATCGKQVCPAPWVHVLSVKWNRSGSLARSKSAQISNVSVPVMR